MSNTKKPCIIATEYILVQGPRQPGFLKAGVVSASGTAQLFCSGIAEVGRRGVRLVPSSPRQPDLQPHALPQFLAQVLGGLLSSLPLLTLDGLQGLFLPMVCLGPVPRIHARDNEVLPQVEA